MSEKRVTPVRPIDSVNAIQPVKVRRTYFRQLQQWRAMSELYAKARKARKAKDEQDK